MKIPYYFLAVILLILCASISCKKESVAPDVKVKIQKDSISTLIALNPDPNPTNLIVSSLYEHDTKDGLIIDINDDLRGGKFIYRAPSSNLVVDTGIIFASKNGGFWEREVSDTIKLAWYNLNTNNADNAVIISNGMLAAIRRKASVITFPFSGTYKVRSGNYWGVPDNFRLRVEGNGATIEVSKAAADASQETYVMAFICTETSNSLNSSLSISNLNIKATDIKPQWTNTNYSEHKLVIAIETNGIYNVAINNCALNDICGYGIRLKDFVSANIDKVIENNVGGHFPIENGFDSFGDGIWLGHYDVQTVRTSRQNSYAKITNSIIKAYDTQTNGNFASRSGITVEGFNSYAPNIVVKVDVSDCTISDYDRNLHVEGLCANINYTNCKMRNFFGLGLVVNSAYSNLNYNNCSASGLLAANPQQERYGLGGIMQFASNLDVFLNKKTVFTFNAPASFRANLHIQDNSVLDFGNSDVFFDNANLFVNTGGSMINLPNTVNRGYNMYGGNVELNGGTFSGYSKDPATPGVFRGTSLSSASVANCKLTNSTLNFTGGFGVVGVSSN